MQMGTRTGLSSILLLVFSCLPLAPAISQLAHNRQKIDSTATAYAEYLRKWDVFADEFLTDTNLWQTHPTTVLLTVTDINYAARFEEFLLSAQKGAGLPVAVIALDKRTYQFFKERKVRTILLDKDKDVVSKYGWSMLNKDPAKEAILRGKIDGTTALLKKGFTVVASEMDVFWTRDPLKTLADFNVHADDFLVESYGVIDYGVCIGFYVAKPTVAMTSAFYILSKWIQSSTFEPDQACDNFDERVIDHMIRGQESHLLESSACSVPWLDRAMIHTANLNWSFIPVNNLPFWNDDFQAGKTQSYLEDPKTFGAHILSASNMRGSQRIQWAYKHGFWYPGAAAPVEMIDTELYPAAGTNGPKN